MNPNAILGFASVVLFLCLLSQEALGSNCSTLRQIHLVFRHGERTPTMVYPNDPYKSIWSDGLGYLTKKGKLQMYNLGQRMRNKYSCYISEYFFPDDVEVRSSYSDRCLMSAQLFNSGFFVPKDEQIWNPEILWQPIPINYKPRNEDNMIAAKQKCKKYDDAYAKLFTTPKYKKILEDNSELFEYLTQHTGMKIDSIRKVEELYNTLEIEKLQNYTLPKWTDEVFPNSMEPIAALCLASLTESEFMKRMKGGAFVKKVLEEMKRSSENSNFPKLLIYSGHDVTLVNSLRTLGVKDLLKPNFAAYLILELHHTQEVKIFYSNCGWCEEEELKLINCKDTCKLKDFEEQLNHVIPEDWQKECE